MKAITIKQPWASLIVEGIKDIENRTWPCPKKYIGKRILIHAGEDRKLDKKPLDIVFNKKQFSVLNELYTELDLCKKHNNYGVIIGSVEIVDCVINHPSIWAEKTKEVTLNIGDIVLYNNTRGNIKNAEITSFKDVGNGKVWFNGIDTQTKAKVWYPTHISLELMGAKTIYNWVLANPIKFPEPIPAKGKLSFWDYPNILAEPEEKDGKLFCHCQLPVKEINQVRPLGGGVFQCRYCGGYWYK